MRDFAILSMLVRFGMRRGEIADLRLDDIDWRAGEIVVRGKGRRLERVLTKLRNERGPCREGL
jgi:integrase/recombinase XerD